MLMRSRFFDDPFFAPFRALEREYAEQQEQTWQPRVELWEDDNGVMLKAELAGVKPEDVDVEIDKNVLTLKGTRHATKREAEGGHFRTEWNYGTFERRFTLPDTLNTENVEANLEDGVLTLFMPRIEAKKPRKVAINGVTETAKLAAA